MSGIDGSNQRLSYHSGLQKTIRWYKKVGVHIFEIFMKNAFYLYSKQTPEPRCLKSIRDLKEAIITNMIGKPKENIFTQPKAYFNYLAPVPPTEKKRIPAEPANTVLPMDFEEKVDIYVSDARNNQHCVSTLVFVSIIKRLVLPFLMWNPIHLMKNDCCFPYLVVSPKSSKIQV